MAKSLLWIYVILNVVVNMMGVYQGYERDVFSITSVWIAIAVIAVCESIEKVKSK
ncbi:hypothetical protein [Lysinibacillus mangiferihumi]|uniref:hypothetical protein n=1 Tax=Lysinibacillus mangiferihumi TaxID=1130819 RepID=UPI00142DFFD7|nr:hypothetical protein [Lysinibacillus mangiferihumi]